jgi:hypothetical protein
MVHVYKYNSIFLNIMTVADILENMSGQSLPCVKEMYRVVGG